MHRVRDGGDWRAAGVSIASDISQGAQRGAIRQLPIPESTEITVPSQPRVAPAILRWSRMSLARDPLAGDSLKRCSAGPWPTCV